MEFEVRLTETYLNKVKYEGGIIMASAILTVCFVISLFYWEQNPAFTQLSANSGDIFQKHQYWKLISTLFVHADIEHLLSNSFMLFFLSYFVHSFFGVITILVLSIIGGSLTNFLVLLKLPYESSLVGISGVIYILWGFWLMLYLCLNKKITVTRRLINIIGIFFILLIPTSYNPQTSYMAHYLGLLIGLLSGFIYYHLHRDKFRLYEKYEVRPIPDLLKDELI